MAHTFLYLSHDRTTNFRSRQKHDLLRVVANKLHGVLGGSESGQQVTVVGSGTDAASACSAAIISSGSGAVGAVINGVSLTDTWATSDTNAAGLVAAVINASTNALVQHLVGATNLKSTVTLASVLAGTTIELAGFRFTAVSGTAGSIPATDGDFVISGTDTQDGTSLAGAINRHPFASRFLFALNVAGAVHVYPKSASWFTGPRAPPNSVRASAATVTVGSATFAASAHVGVWCKLPGKLGNAISCTATGTGVTIENTNTRLTRGLGMDAAPVSEVL
jgi:hypothetical protein